MNSECHYIHELASESERIGFSSLSAVAKECSLLRHADMTGWDDESPSTLSNITQNTSVASPIHLKQQLRNLKEKDSLKSPKKHKKRLNISLPEVVSAYEISKYHPRYKEFFNQPLKTSKEKVRFPSINNKSLLSVYLSTTFERKHLIRRVEPSNNVKLSQGLSGIERKPNWKPKGQGELGGYITTTYNSSNLEKNALMAFE